MKAPARSSRSPPISPIITIASVSWSSWNACRQSMWVVPITGSPPMPTAVEKPMSRSSYIIWYVSVPDLETRPIRPAVVMSAGMMPALDLPGEATPGQFGPMILVTLPAALARAQNCAVSCTGIPSVITMHSGIRAPIASITASLLPDAGTNTTDTSAPVAAMVSATVPNTGTPAPFSSMVWPALRGLVPPTTLVPAASIRAPCLRPSEPVMPWIMTRLWPVRKMAISGSLRCKFGGPAGRAVHRRYLLDHADGRLVKDPPGLGGVVPGNPDHDRAVDRLPALGQHADRRDDPVSYRVAGGDAAEDVHEHAAHAGVGQHDLQAVRHHVGGGAAADVEEVGRPDPAERLAGVGHHVQGGHDQPGPVADDADLAVELDVVEVLRQGPGLDRVGVGDVVEAGVLLAERGGVIQRHLAVDREHLAVLGKRHRVDLDQRGVFVGEHGPEPFGQQGSARRGLGRDAAGRDDLRGLGAVHAGQRRHRDPGHRLRATVRDLFDLHAALDRADRQEGAVGPVQQERQVVLGRDVDRLGDQHRVHGVALDVHAENLAGLGVGLVRALGQLHAAGLAAPAGLHLRLHHDQGVPLGGELRGDLARFFGRVGDLAGLYRDAVLGEQFLRLILKQVHSYSPLFPLLISLIIRSVKILVA